MDLRVLSRRSLSGSMTFVATSLIDRAWAHTSWERYSTSPYRRRRAPRATVGYASPRPQTCRQIVCGSGAAAEPPSRCDKTARATTGAIDIDRPRTSLR